MIDGIRFVASPLAGLAPVFDCPSSRRWSRL